MPAYTVRMFSRRSLFRALLAAALVPRRAESQARLLGKPRPLSPNAVIHDWQSFLGPTYNAVSTETRLTRALPPPLIWDLPKGEGYSSPAIAGGLLVFLHRVGEEEVVDCVHPETGARQWQFKYR